MTPDERRDWLTDRRKGLGGSDAGAVLGLSPWKTPWDIFVDKIYGSEDEQTEIQKIGHWMEPILIEFAAEELGQTRWVPGERLVAGCLRGTLDATFPEIRTILDCKVGHGWSAWSEEIPEHIVAQLNHYRWLKEQATGEEWSCKLAVYHRLIGKRAMYDVPRRPWGAEVVSLTAWWHTHIVDGVPPEVDGSAGCAKALRLMRNPKGGTVGDYRIATQAERELVERFYEVAATRDHLTAERDLIRNQLRAAIGDLPGIRYTGGRASLSPTGRLTVRVDD